MVDSTIIGTQLEPTSLHIDAGRLRLFAKATGETRAAYTDGEPLPVPPTFLFAIELEHPDPFGWLADVGVDMRTVLHGEQTFEYHAVVRSGQTLTASPRIVDYYEKKDGALKFITKHTVITTEDGSAVADLNAVLVVRN